MIARLRGLIIERSPGLLVVDVGGVGYEMSVTQSTSRDAGASGEPVELFVHTHAREGALALYGFDTTLDKALFVRLIEVNGVGPKMALAALSGLGAIEIVDAVRGRDARHLSTVPGIGRKTADRIVLEMTDRLDDLAAISERTKPAEGGAARPSSVRRDLISALVNLGYNARVATEAAGEVLGREPGPLPPFEALLRQSLKQLSH